MFIFSDRHPGPHCYSERVIIVRFKFELMTIIIQCLLNATYAHTNKTTAQQPPMNDWRATD